MNEVSDARITDPAPTKLKGKAGATSGNFGVMVVSLASEASARRRHFAAKQSREDTVRAAKLAETNGYVSFAISRAPASSKPPGPSRLSPPDSRGCFLDTNTKTEQAQLLKFLRGLSPVSVIDQFCRALDFFGSKQIFPGQRGMTFGLYSEAPLGLDSKQGLLRVHSRQLGDGQYRNLTISARQNVAELGSFSNALRRGPWCPRMRYVLWLRLLRQLAAQARGRHHVMQKSGNSCP